MAKKVHGKAVNSANYTLWTIPRAEWQAPSAKTQLPTNAESKLKSMSQKPVNEGQIEPFRTPVTEESMNTPFDQH